MIVKTPSLVREYQYVSMRDPALDNEVEDFSERMDRFRDTGDLKHLPLKNGQDPVVWTLGHIRGRAKEHMRLYMHKTALDDGQVSGVACVDACKLALQGVENLTYDTGKKVELDHHRDPKTGFRCLTDDCVNELYEIDEMFVLEIGMIALGAMVTPKK